MQDNAETIKKITLADELVYDKLDGFTKEWNINGEKVTLGVNNKCENKKEVYYIDFLFI